jgi:Icc-related predicted phosphoesterase
LAVADRVHPLLYDHFHKERFSDIDLILSAGDLRAKFLSFLVTMLNKPCYYVRGNHDIVYTEEAPLGCEDIDGKVVNHEGIRILGLEGSMWYGGKGVEYTESQMRWKIFKLKSKIWAKRGVDIVLTHAPPKGIHDGKDLCHTGFSSFIKLIEKYRPQYFLHGHTHASYGYSREKITQVQETKVVNVEGYHTFEIESLMRRKKLVKGGRIVDDL